MDDRGGGETAREDGGSRSQTSEGAHPDRVSAQTAQRSKPVGIPRRRARKKQEESESDEGQRVLRSDEISRARISGSGTIVDDDLLSLPWMWRSIRAGG